ncbi:MAG: hypothetical protein E7528_08185 [Ruminococcaceae bacterium]|nr:hypothetical protein [Oscillospiraceae bacterium]
MKIFAYERKEKIMKKTSKIVSIILTVIMLMGLMTSVSYAADVSYVVSDTLPTTMGWSAAAPGEILVYVPVTGENTTYYLDLYKDDELINGNYEATFTANGKQTSDVFKTKIEELGAGEYKYKIGLERDEDCGEVRKNTGFSLEYLRTLGKLATPTELTYDDTNKTLSWSHDMENLSTFKVEFYAKKSSDNTLVHIQSNTDGDLRNNTTFSWNDYADLLNTLNAYLTNETYSDVLARVQALADANYENSDFSDWVSLKTGTKSAATPSTPADIKEIKVISWAKSNYKYKDIGNLIFETDTECKKYIVRTYFDDEKMGNDSIITPDETPTTKTASVTFSNSGRYYITVLGVDENDNVIASATTNEHIYYNKNGTLIPPKNLRVEDGKIKWTKSLSAECASYKMQVWFNSADNPRGINLGEEVITGYVDVKELFERYDFDSRISELYAFTENLNVNIIACTSDNNTYREGTSESLIIEPISKGTWHRLHWTGTLVIGGNSIADDFVSTNLSENVSEIKNLKLLESVASIGENAFAGCTNLTNAVIPETVNSIENGAFNCIGLNSIYIYNAETEIFDSADTLKCSAIYGYPNSTAEDYADKYGIEFFALEADFTINDGAETTSDKNVSIKFNDYAMDNYSKYKINGGEYADITTNTVAYTLDGEDGAKTIEITFSDGTNEKTITHTITLSTESTTGGDVSTNEDITYDGVKEIGGIDGIITAEDTEYVNTPGNTLEIKVSVEPTSENTNISTAITNNYSQYTTSQMFNIDINKIKTGAENSTTPITETASLLSVNVEIPSTITGKDEYIVLREHNGAVDALKTAPNTDGEYITVSNDTINIYAKKFSTYMIIAKDVSYTPSRGSGGGVSRYTVKFDTNGGNSIKAQTISRNNVAKAPETPIKDGFTFDGWYSDKELTSVFDFETKITKSITLYAKWKEVPTNKIILTIGQKDALVNGETITNDVAPKIVNERTMLPIRFIAEKLGASVDWVQESQTVIVELDDIKISLVIGENFAMVNNEKIELDSASFVEDGRTFLPIRFVMENLGANVLWNNDTQTVTITK